jgi:hypothetical protein
VGLPQNPRRVAGSGHQGRRLHSVGDPPRGRHRPRTTADIADLGGVSALPSPRHIAADSFEASTLSGARIYVLAIIEHTTRRIRILGATAHPTATWVTRAARNLVMDIQDAGCQVKYLIRALIWNQAHLLHALREYERHYNFHRSHRGTSNARPLRRLPQPITDPATITHLHIHRRDRLGGLLHEYEHAA